MLDHSIGHGRHRSSSSGYDAEQVLKEYIILHKILTNILKSQDAYSIEVADLLKYIIENSMLFAAGAFSNSLQDIRQKLIAILAHDMRNPASAAYMAISMMKSEEDPERREKIGDMAGSSIKRVLGLIEDLLHSVLVKAGEGMTLDFSEKDLVPYIESLHGEASEIYSNEILLDCDEQEIRGVFDAAMIRRVLENIVNNAVKYGERGTRVTISVEDSAEYVHIKVHNEGNPIPKKKQKEIFQFSNTSNGSGSGNIKSWGLGLSLVDAVAKGHGGYLELNSSKEAGTTFILVLGKNKNKPGKVKTALNFGDQKDYFSEN